MDTNQGQLIGGEIRYGKVGFFCASGRRHVFLHLFSEGSGTGMDIGPCEGELCPYAQTHGLIGCGSCEHGSLSCLESRRIALDRKRHGHDTSILPFGRKRGRRECSIVTVKGGGLIPDWYAQLALDAETGDRLTSDWPDDWPRRKCEASERGHHWIYKDDNGMDLGRDADGRNFGCWDTDAEPDYMPQASQRHCLRCPVTQTKRANGEWSGDRDSCPCCAELPSEHSEYY
jgi:hypothetical protein